MTENNHPCATAVEGHGGIVKDLKEWTSNNWRKTGTVKETKEMKVNIGTIVERMFCDWVNEMLCDLADMEELGQNSQREFQLRNQAIKTVRESLSPEELVAVQAKKTRVALSGHPPEKQSANYGHSRIEADDKKCFLEMGMLSLSLVAWVDTTREFKVQVNDSMAYLMGSQKQNFTEKNKDFVQEMLRKFLEYMFYLHEMLCVIPNVGTAIAATSTGINAPTGDESRKSEVGTDSQGYPQLPKVLLVVTKDLVKLCREYMNVQYSIATGKLDSRMCVAEVCGNPKLFIGNGCLPKDWDMSGNVCKNSMKKHLQDPQNMDKGMLLDLLEHWHFQEIAHRCSTALQFTHYMHGKVRLPAAVDPAPSNGGNRLPQKSPTVSTLNLDTLLPFEGSAKSGAGEDTEVGHSTTLMEAGNRGNRSRDRTLGEQGHGSTNRGSEQNGPTGDDNSWECDSIFAQVKDTSCVDSTADAS
ncbi:hypothetical protein DXG01_005486 [Tephrocybe rancida]|nr:hypothetical protein DXG01_005486 [Tephrocybe rancida]